MYEGTETFTNRSGMRMVYVPQAEFKMGGGDWEKCPDGLPVHPVRITKSFWIADVPVTQALFQKFWKEGILDPESNVQFGEGGAGTFSDGKLNTLVKDPIGRNQKVLEILEGRRRRRRGYRAISRVCSGRELL